MSTFLTVLSFPLWFFGALFLILSVFGKVTKNSVPVYGMQAMFVRFLFGCVGSVICGVAYVIVVV